MFASLSSVALVKKISERHDAWSKNKWNHKLISNLLYSFRLVIYYAVIILLDLSTSTQLITLFPRVTPCWKHTAPWFCCWWGIYLSQLQSTSPSSDPSLNCSNSWQCICIHLYHAQTVEMELYIWMMIYKTTPTVSECNSTVVNENPRLLTISQMS